MSMDSKSVACPQEFQDYIASKYGGVVYFTDLEWHAKRLWRAAMHALATPPQAAPESAKRFNLAHDLQEIAAEFQDRLTPYALEALDLAAKQLANPPQAAAQPAQQGGWPCEIAEADFEADTITVHMLTNNYAVRAGKHYLVAAPTPKQGEE